MADVTKFSGTFISDIFNSRFRTTSKKLTFLYAFLFVFVAFTFFPAFFSSSFNNSSSSPWFTNLFTLTTPNTNESYRSHFSSIFTFFSPPEDSDNSTSITNTTTTQAFKPQNVSIFNDTISNNQTQNGDFQRSGKEAFNSTSPVSQLKNATSSTNLSGGKANPIADKKNKPNTSSRKVGEEIDEGLIRSLSECDMFDGSWVRDESYPLYKSGSCKLIDEQFNCFLNGRQDNGYYKLKWQPKGCNLPRLDAKKLLEMLRGKRLVFVGDSLNRNMWESLICILKSAVNDEKKVYEEFGRHHFKTEAWYSFMFDDYKCTVEFFVSPFLVEEWVVTEKNGTKRETLRLDIVSEFADKYKTADIIVFNTGHWWTHEKTSLGKDYYQEGSHVYKELNVLEAFRKALTYWGRWVDANINPKKSLLFFRGYSASHFSGGQWNSGGQCDHETEAIRNTSYLSPYPSKMVVLEKVLRGMNTPVTYLNVTRMTDFRKDGHPSIYRKQNMSEQERKSPLSFQDCSHWCLPGVPDSWNEILYAQLLVKLKNQI